MRWDIIIGLPIGPLKIGPCLGPTRRAGVAAQALRGHQAGPALSTIDRASGRARVVLFRVVSHAGNRARAIWNTISADNSGGWKGRRGGPLGGIASKRPTEAGCGRGRSRAARMRQAAADSARVRAATPVGKRTRGQTATLQRARVGARQPGSQFSSSEDEKQFCPLIITRN
jgi:hypothetical protein